jgi:hypothetical protein
MDEGQTAKTFPQDSWQLADEEHAADQPPWSYPQGTNNSNAKRIHRVLNEVEVLYGAQNEYRLDQGTMMSPL